MSHQSASSAGLAYRLAYCMQQRCTQQTRFGSVSLESCRCKPPSAKVASRPHRRRQLSVTTNRTGKPTVLCQCTEASTSHVHILPLVQVIVGLHTHIEVSGTTLSLSSHALHEGQQQQLSRNAACTLAHSMLPYHCLLPRTAETAGCCQYFHSCETRS